MPINTGSIHRLLCALKVPFVICHFNSIMIIGNFYYCNFNFQANRRLERERETVKSKIRQDFQSDLSAMSDLRSECSELEHTCERLKSQLACERRNREEEAEKAAEREASLKRKLAEKERQLGTLRYCIVYYIYCYVDYINVFICRLDQEQKTQALLSAISNYSNNVEK